MNVITFYNKDVLTYIGGYQPIDPNGNYRFSKFVIKHNLNDDIIVLFNTLVGSLVLLSKDEYDNIFNDMTSDWLTYLYKTYFVVKESFNEDMIIDTFGNDCDETRFKKLYADNLYEKVNSFTIMTTSKCNARCFYCYQKEDFKIKQNMSLDVANDAINYMISKMDNNKPLHISWFGGEPLYNMKIIDYISDKLTSKNIKFTSSITTNGYYFTKKNVDKAVNNWHITGTQVSLDGTELNYNKIKNYVNNDSNPFKRVINNIKLMLDANIRVSIRLNCSENNVDDMVDLTDFLFDNFKDYPKFSIYTTPLFSETSNNIINTDSFIEKFIRLREHICNQTRNTPEGFNELMQGLHHFSCMASNLNSIMINPDGKITNCEHWNHPIGSIYENTYDKEYIKYFTTTKKFNEICHDCKLRPMCVRMEKCPGSPTNGCGICKTINDKHVKEHLLYLNIALLIERYFYDIQKQIDNDK